MGSIDLVHDSMMRMPDEMAGNDAELSPLEEWEAQQREIDNLPENINEDPENIQNLVDFWEEFVNPAQRAKNMEKFLFELVKNCQGKIIDICAGAGYEVMQLQRLRETKGLDIACIKASEYSPAFRKLLKANLAQEKEYLETLPPEIRESVHEHYDDDIMVHSVNWFNLASEYAPNSFEKIFRLGNSTTYIHDMLDRRDIDSQIRQILAYTGKYVDDTRFYEPAVKKMEDLMKRETAATHKDFGYTKSLMYCGKTIVGHPIGFRAHKTEPGKQNLIIKYYCPDDPSVKPAYLELYPFGRNERRRELESANMEVIAELHDGKEKQKKRPGMIQYVCKKKG